jgi:hypothetical protein
MMSVPALDLVSGTFYCWVADELKLPTQTNGQFHTYFLSIPFSTKATFAGRSARRRMK